MTLAVVTGGTRGIGAAISRRLAVDGGHVAAVYRSDDDVAHRFGEVCAADGLSVSVHRADLADPAACVGVLTRITERHGPVAHLVNNAGVLLEAAVLDTGTDLWDAVHAVNARAAFVLVREVWGAMLTAGYGRVVNIGSVTASSGNPVEAAYAASKAALIGLTRSLARAGAPSGITVNLVVPGVYETDMTAGMSEQDQRRIARMIPVGRRGRPEELAHLVAALLHPQAGYITGAVLQADGGLGMGA